MIGRRKRRYNLEDLRHEAETKACNEANLQQQNIETMSKEELRGMLHELQIHQIELEMQNDELRATHDKLESSRARYFDFYDLSPVGYLTISEKGLITEANLTAANMLNLPRNALLKQPVSSFILPKDQDIYYSHRNAVLKTRQADAYDLRLVRAGQTPLWVELNVTVVPDESGRAVCRVVINDITRRKQAEEALLLCTERLQTILDSVDALIYIVDMETYEILLINAYGRKIWGDVAGQKCWKALQAQTEPCSFCQNNKLLTPDGQPVGVYRWEFQNLVSRQWYDLRDRAIKWVDGRWVKLEIATDITEQKKAAEHKLELERQLQDAQKVESLGRMAGGIAHQFNNLLSVVIGNLELTMEDPLAARIPGNKLAGAMSAACRAAEVSSLMLGYLGQSVARKDQMDLSEYCRQYLLNLCAGAPENITIEPALPVSGPVIIADAVQIRQIVGNLFINAQEAIGDRHGVVSISIRTAAPLKKPATRCFPAEFAPDKCKYACIEVKDTGCGIEESDIGKLFDPFYTTKVPGRGLGLSLVLGDVRAMGGCIAVESKPGQGSIFQVFLPIIAPPADLQSTCALDHTATLKTGTVLLVEDEPMVCEMAAAMLTHMGMKVLKAMNGVEAMELFEEHRDEIICVVCDIMMPRMDGWETLAALRHLSPDIPVIMASGYSESQAMEGNRKERPQMFLEKPYSMQALKSAIAKATRKH